jgi:hypothetical protein
MRRVGAAIVAVEKHIFSLSYPAWAPYFHLWPFLYSIFPHYLKNGTFFKNITERKICVPIFFTTFL